MSRPPPRVLIVSPARTTRGLLGAELRERGYDAVGAASLGAALRIARDERGHGPVGLVIVASPVTAADAHNFLTNARDRFGGCVTLLVARGAGGTATGVTAGWDRVLKRPVSIGEIATAAEVLLPLAADRRHPVDD